MGVILTLVIGYGLVNYLAVPGNGAKIGHSTGKIANKGSDAVGGAGNMVTAFFDNLSK